MSGNVSPRLLVEGLSAAAELDAVYDLVPVAMARLDVRLRLVRCNRRALELLGLEAHETRGRKLLELAPWLAPELEGVLAALAAGGGQAECAVERSAGGQSGPLCLHVALRALPVWRNEVAGILCCFQELVPAPPRLSADNLATLLDEQPELLTAEAGRGYRLVADGRPTRLLLTARDVTQARLERQALEQARREAEAAARCLSTVLESTTDSVLVLNRRGRVTYANRRALNRYGARGLKVGLRLVQVLPEETGGELDHRLREAMRRQLPVSFEGHLSAQDAWIEVHAYPCAQGLSIFFRDVSERCHALREHRAAQERIAHMAKHDGLTGLPNRVLFNERLAEALCSAAAAGRYAVLCLDLDEFKVINDTLGHPAGDELLQHVAARLRGWVRSGDTVARFGGDEFAVLQRVRRQQDAARLARRVIRALSEPFDIGGHRISIGTSVGIAMVSDGSDSPASLIKAADIALHRAKGEGRGRFCLFEHGMERDLLERQQLRDGLQSALADDQFELHFEPQLNLISGRLRCFEALIRWNRPGRGLVSPAEFIPEAESSGLIVPIGAWVLREACREAAYWPQSVRLAVNLSPVQFRSPSLVHSVTQALEAAGMAPNRLELEITESVLLENSEANLTKLHALRQLGARIVLDDFGTGYSSLSYLRSFPFDKVKVDRCFVAELPNGVESDAIIRAVVDLCRRLGITTSAEGVETREQLEALCRKGCDEAQGYLFSRPVPAREIAELTARLQLGTLFAPPAP